MGCRGARNLRRYLTRASPLSGTTGSKSRLWWGRTARLLRHGCRNCTRRILQVPVLQSSQDSLRRCCARSIAHLLTTDTHRKAPHPRIQCCNALRTLDGRKDAPTSNPRGVFYLGRDLERRYPALHEMNSRSGSVSIVFAPNVDEFVRRGSQREHGSERRRVGSADYSRVDMLGAFAAGGRRVGVMSLNVCMSVTGLRNRYLPRDLALSAFVTAGAYALHPTPHPTPCTPHPKPCTLHLTPCALHPTPYTLHPTPYTIHPTPYTLHPAPYTSHPTPYTLYPAPYTLHPTPYTLHPTPYTLHPTPYTLHPTPYTLHPTPHTHDPAPYTLHPATCILHPTP